MAIRDKDGNVYVLRGPNKLMIGQEKWDTHKLVFINTIGKTTLDQSKTRQNPFHKLKEDYKILDIGEELELINNEEFAEELVPDQPVQAPVQEPQVQEVILVDEEDDVVEINVDSKLADKLKRSTKEFYGVIASKRIRKDDFYGTTSTVITYSPKITFDAIIISQNEYVLKFWTTKVVTEQSVVFPKNFEFCWYRVDNVTPKSGGFLCEASISDVNPDFS